MSRSLRIYVAAVSGTFWLSVAVGMLVHGAYFSPTLAAVAPMVGLAIVFESMLVRMRGISLSFSATAHIAAAVMYGPLVASLIAAGAVFVVDGVRLVPRRFVLMNSAMFGCAIGLAGLVFVGLGGSSRVTDPSNVLPLVALIGVRMLVNEMLLAGAIASSESCLFWPTAWDGLRGGLSSTVGEGCLGVLVAFAYHPDRWVMMVFLTPLLILLYRATGNFEQLRAETQNALATFAQVIDERDTSTAEHSQRVAGYVERFCRAIGLGDRETRRLVEAARYHDLGKVGVDVATLASSARLTEAELRTIQAHPRLSARLLTPFRFAEEMAVYAELHHERYDGTGYYGVPRDEVPVEAHLLIVADSYDAMTSARAYRPALTAAEAVQEVRDKAGIQFHPGVASAFAAMIEDHDPGHAMGRGELERLRAEFSQVKTADLRWLHELARPGTIAVMLGASTLVNLGAVGGVTRWVMFQALAAATAAAWTLATGIHYRRRERRAVEVLERTGCITASLRAAGVEAWAAWLHWEADLGQYAADRAGQPEAPAAQLEEARIRALRPGVATTTTALSTGGWVTLTPPKTNRVRLAVGGPWLTDFERHLVDVLAARAHPAASHGTARPGLRSIDGTNRRQRSARQACADVLVDLCAFENLRIAAGQLSAERVVAEAVTRVAALTRSGDSVTMLGDDRFRVSITATGHEELASICRRIETAIRSVRVPRRADQIQPRIRVVDGDAAPRPGPAATRDEELRRAAE